MSRHRPAARQEVHGVLLLDKPIGISSQVAVTRARHLLNAAKAGHTGTLDPMASGLLPVCFGEATKFSRFMLDADKTYVATVQLGVVTTTGDMEGAVTATSPVQADQAQVEAVLQRFRGEIWQMPPMYSALKHAGKPLYRYAREGKVVARTPRKVRVHSIECTNFSGDVLSLTVKCGKGTYVRVLAEDIGNALGCGGTLSGLVRTAVGHYRLDAAWRLEKLEGQAPAARYACLRPVDSLADSLPCVELDDHQSGRILAGRPCEAVASFPPDTLVRIYGPTRQFLGIGITADGNTIAPHRLISLRPGNIARNDGAAAWAGEQTMLEKTNS